MIDIFGILLLFLTFLVSIRLIQEKKIKINEPPMVPYKFPIIGHSLEWLRDPDAFLNDAREKYGEIFTIYVFGWVLTITGKGLCYEFMNSSQMSFFEFFFQKVPLFDLFGVRTPDADDILFGIARTLMLFMDKFRSRVQRTLQQGIDEFIGDCDEPKTVRKPIGVIGKIIARALVSIYLGEELSHDKEVVNTFATFTADMTARTRKRALPDMINPWLGKQLILLSFKFGNNPASKHRQIILDRIKPIIGKRLEERKRLCSEWKAPVDLLQVLIDHPLNDRENPNVEWIVSYMLILVWVGVHTTSSHATDVLQAYAGRPEYWQELFDEQLEIVGDNTNLEITGEQLNRMVRLDSFIKETLRTFGHIATLFHKTMVPVFTFSNGYQVPKGRGVGVHDTTITKCNGPADEFDGRRFLGKNSPASRVGRDFIIFGIGKHACPGRNLAITEIKTFMSKIIRLYNVTMENGKPPTKRLINGIAIVSDEALIFENRKK